MTWPEYFGALAIVAFLLAFGLYIIDDLTKPARLPRGHEPGRGVAHPRTTTVSGATPPAGPYNWDDEEVA